MQTFASVKQKYPLGVSLLLFCPIFNTISLRDELLRKKQTEIEASCFLPAAQNKGFHQGKTFRYFACLLAQQTGEIKRERVLSLICLKLRNTPKATVSRCVEEMPLLTQLTRECGAQFRPSRLSKQCGYFHWADFKLTRVLPM